MGAGSSCEPHSLFPKRKVTLSLVGLDDAGKTSLVQMITGVSEAELTLAGYQLTLLDLPGDPGLRTLWADYYHRCHGLVFVVDSANKSRFKENETVFSQTLTHPHLTGKPVLLMLNKQDHQRAFSRGRLEQCLSVGSIVERSECSCTVIKCSAMPDCHKSLGKKAIRFGLRGLLRRVSSEYQVLCERVQEDTENIRVMDEETRRGSERLVKIEEEPEGEMNGEISEGSEEDSVATDSLESSRENGPPETTLHVLKRAAHEVQFLSSATRTDSSSAELGSSSAELGSSSPELGSSSPELGELFVDGILNQLRESSPSESQLTCDFHQTEPALATSPERTRPIDIRKPTATSEDGAGFTRQDVKQEATAIVEAFLNDIQALSETAGGPSAEPQALLFACRLIDELQRKIGRFYVQPSPDQATSEGEASPERTDSPASVAARRGSSSPTLAKKSPILERIRGHRWTPVQTQGQGSKVIEFEQVTLPGTPINENIVFDSCPIVRRTTIDTGDDDDLPEESVDGGSRTISRVVDSLLGSVKSDHRLLAPSDPRLDPARLGDLSRNLLDQLNALLTAHNKLLQLQTQAGERRSFSDTVLIKHHGNRGDPQPETAVPSELVYGFAERSVRRLLLPFLQEPVCSLTTSSCSSSQDSSEIFQQAVSLLSTVMVDQVIENLSGSSQSSTTGPGVQESEFSTVGQDQGESTLLQVDKKKKKKHRHTDAQTSPHHDFISPNTVSPGVSPGVSQTQTGPVSGSQPVSQTRTGRVSGSKLQDKPAKRSVFAKALSSLRKGLCNVFKKKTKSAQ